MSQQARLLNILKERREISNFELHDLKPPIFQIPTRIFELREQGYPIIGFHDEHDRRRYWYKYVEPKKDLFAE